nr:unnamed protein product [Callosobruchus analis]
MPINNTVGLFFHEECSLKISNSKWNLLVYRDLLPLKQAIEHNDNILDGLLSTFHFPSNNRMVAFKAEIQTHSSLLKQISNHVNTKYEELTLGTKNYDLRQKRGIFNGLGTVWKLITGNLDATDGQYFSDCIDKITHDEHNIERLMQKQISVTTSVIKNFNSTIQKLHIDEETFNKNIIEIQNLVMEISDDLAFYQAQVKFLDLCESLMESYSFIKDSLNDMLNAVTFAHLKILHGSIIKPSDLVESLRQISQHLQKNNLPLPISTSTIAQYIDLIKLEAYQLDTRIVFILNIPLINHSPYTLFRLCPIPLLDNRTGLHHSISTNNKYIARDDDSLFLTTLQNLDHCKDLQARTKICSDVLPYPIDSDAICEAQLLRQQTKLPKNCQSSIFHGQGYHIQLLQENVWLTTTTDPVSVTVKCENEEVVTRTIQINSLIRLGPKCNAFVGSTRIHAETSVDQLIDESAFRAQMSPIIIPYNCCDHLPEKSKNPELKPLKINKLDVQDLNIAQHNLNRYSEELDRIINEPFIRKHIDCFTILTITVIVLLITLYTYCKCRKSRRLRIGIVTNTNDGNDFPPSPPRQTSFRNRISSFVPRRRPSIHLEETLEEGIELNPNKSSV